ncbi:MAG: PRC-barrel domain-containing protein [Candidatus Bathyarchaeota archaeon]|nr:PRC-barrel domain-containing protein [Candidatus Bathyarchaeota archaeon]
MTNSALLNDRRVVTSDAWDIGKVDGIEIDTEKWTVTHLRVSLSKDSAQELRFKKPILGDVVVCIPINRIKAFGDVITLDALFSDIASLAECQ